MKTIVITGSTRGIGLGMAKEFLKREHQVIISGRSEQSVNQALAELKQEYLGEKIHGIACDVSDYAQVENLWQQSIEKFGQVDIWVNNAGVSHENEIFTALNPEIFTKVINTNLIGVMNCVQVAIKGMESQGFGFIYNMEGFGSDGRMMKGLSVYGASKRGMTYLTAALVKEFKNSFVKIGFLSPGMVVTDLLIGDIDQTAPDWENRKRIFNILADRVESVAPFLVENMLINSKHGAKIIWLTNLKVILRFLSAPFVKRNIL